MISGSKVTLLYFAREALVVGCLDFADCGCAAAMLGCPQGAGALCPPGCAAPALPPGAHGAVLEISTAALQTHVFSSSCGRRCADLASGHLRPSLHLSLYDCDQLYTAHKTLPATGNAISIPSPGTSVS